MTPMLAQRQRTDRAFERIYRQNVRNVYGYALAMLHSPEDAEDVTQATFLNAYRAFERGERPGSPDNWLISIVHGICDQRARQEARIEEVAYDDHADERSPRTRGRRRTTSGEHSAACRSTSAPPSSCARSRAVAAQSWKRSSASRAWRSRRSSSVPDAPCARSSKGRSPAIRPSGRSRDGSTACSAEPTGGSFAHTSASAPTAPVSPAASAHTGPHSARSRNVPLPASLASFFAQAKRFSEQSVGFRARRHLHGYVGDSGPFLLFGSNHPSLHRAPLGGRRPAVCEAVRESGTLGVWE